MITGQEILEKYNDQSNDIKDINKFITLEKMIDHALRDVAQRQRFECSTNVMVAIMECNRLEGAHKIRDACDNTILVVDE